MRTYFQPQPVSNFSLFFQVRVAGARHVSPDKVCLDVFTANKSINKIDEVEDGSEGRLCCLCNAGQYMSKICDK